MHPIYKPVPYQLHVGWNNSHVELLCSWKTHFRYVNARKLGLNSQHGVMEGKLEWIHHLQECWSRRQCDVPSHIGKSAFLLGWKMGFQLAGPTVRFAKSLQQITGRGSWSNHARASEKGWSEQLAGFLGDIHMVLIDRLARIGHVKKGIRSIYFSRVWLGAHLVDTPKKSPVNWSLP